MEDVLILGTVGREKVHSFGITSSKVFGGTAYYATEAILRAGVTRPLLASALGNDLTYAELIDQFSGPINVSAVERNPTLPSFYWEARYDHSFEESTTTALENRLFDAFAPDWADLGNRYPGIRFCYLAAFDPQVQLACSRHFENCFVVSETLQYWIERDRQGVLDLASQSNGFVVTEREFCALWGFEAPPFTPYERVSSILKQCGVDFLIITFAQRGSQVFDAEGTFMVPALSCDTIDSTGAGNAFSGGIAGYLARHRDYNRARLCNAVALGTALASLQVRGFGNAVLRAASFADIEMLRQQARNGINWFDPKV